MKAFHSILVLDSVCISRNPHAIYSQRKEFDIDIMYKLLIVEDEPIVRQGITQMINFEEFGFELTAACENGAQAKQIIAQNPPDAIISDICMPYVDGLELCSYVHDQYPNIKTILLTGYDEFEYARQALTAGVLDYLLKPITKKQFKALLEKLKIALDRDYTEKQKYISLESDAYKGEKVAKEQFLNKLVTTPMDTDIFQENVKKLDLPLIAEAYITASVKLCESEDIKSKLSQAVNYAAYNVADEICGKHPGAVAFQNIDGNTSLIISGQREGLEQFAQLVIEEVYSALTSSLWMEVHIGIGYYVTHIRRLPESYQSAQIALYYQFLSPDKNIINIADMVSQKSSSSFLSQNRVLDITNIILDGDEPLLARQIHTLFTDIRSTYMTFEQCVFYLNHLLEKISISVSRTIDRQVVGIAVSPGTGKEKTLEQLEHQFLESCQKMLQATKAAPVTQPEKQGEKAAQYIDEHFSDPDLSLKDICSHLAISVSYFSSIFKAYTDLTFVEYLTERRIEKAKQLLKNTDKSIAEISEAVGYKEPHYFSMIFKKSTDMTPKNYRKHSR